MSAKRTFRSLLFQLNKALNGMATDNRRKMKTFRVAVEGNIGCGKTSFLNNFEVACKEKVKIFSEPVNKWRNVRGINLLDLMYDDPKKWSFAFQQYVQLTMFQVHKEMSEYDDGKAVLKMMERSLLSARYCFVENLLQSGLMTRVEYDIIDEWYQKLMKSESTNLDCIIYLRTDPDVCLKRIKQRNREEEQYIDLSYLKTLHNLHEKWLSNLQASNKCAVIPVNANASFEELRCSYEKCSEYIFEEKSERIAFEHCI